MGLRLGSRRALFGAMGGGLTSLRNLFTAAALQNQVAWWDSERDVYADTGLTTLATADGVVKGWKDQGSSGYHVTRDNTVSECVLKSVSGKTCVRFVTGGYLSRNIASAILAGLNTFTIFIIYSSSTWSEQIMYSEGRSSSGTPTLTMQLITGSPGGRGAGFHRDNAGTNANPLPASGVNALNGSKHLLVMRRISASSYSLRLDGVEIGTSTNTPTTTTIDRLALGAWVRSTIGTYFNGDLYQTLLYSSDNYATVEPILANYYGITLPA